MQKNVQPFQKITVNEAPLSYMIILSKEVKECLRDVKLINDYHLQYFIQEFVLAVRQGRIFQNGDLLNSDIDRMIKSIFDDQRVDNIQRKKFDNMVVMYLNVSIHCYVQRTQQQCKLDQKIIIILRFI